MISFGTCHIILSFKDPNDNSNILIAQGDENEATKEPMYVIFRLYIENIQISKVQ